MRILRRLAALSGRERLLLLRALVCLIKSTIVVRLLPYRFLRNWIRTEPNPVRKSSQQQVQPERIAWAIDGVAGRMPATSCLIRALAARSLMARYGYSAKLRIGVARSATGQLTSHAWLEQNGCAVLGGRTAPLEYEVLDIPVGSVTDRCTPTDRS